MIEEYPYKIEQHKQPEEFTTFDNYITIPILDLENINEYLLRFYKDNDVEIKLRLHSKSEYEFNGKIIEMYGEEESIKEDEEEDRKEEEDISIPQNIGYIPISHYKWERFYIILQDNKDNKIKLFLADIDHRTIMPKAIQAITPLLIFERERIPPKLRFEILERDSHTCQYCGRKPPEVVLEIDHIVPVSKGGKTEKLNLTTSCRDCNIGKSDTILNN